jgi:Putative zinc-finger
VSNQRANEAATEHQAVSLLIPWYVNDTLEDGERSRVEEHLTGCAACRNDLALEQRIYQGVSAGSSVEYMPAASLNRLREKLDGKPAGDAQVGLTAQMPRRRRLRHWRGLTAASIIVMAVAIGVLAVDRWLQDDGRRAAPLFYTVTNDGSRSPDEVVRAVFSPNITLVELQSLLDEAQLRIISGPSEAGVYSLAAKSDLPVSKSLALLRQHAAVRFAEGTNAAAAHRNAP